MWEHSELFKPYIYIPYTADLSLTLSEQEIVGADGTRH